MINKKVTASGIELTADIENFIDKKIEAIKKFDSDGDESQLTIEISKTTNHHQKGDFFEAKMNLQMGRNSFRAVADAEDIKSAIDRAKDEIVHEITKVKGRRLRLLKRGHQKIKNIIRGFRGE